MFYFKEKLASVISKDKFKFGSQPVATNFPIADGKFCPLSFTILGNNTLTKY